MDTGNYEGIWLGMWEDENCLLLNLIVAVNNKLEIWFKNNTYYTLQARLNLLCASLRTYENSEFLNESAKGQFSEKLLVLIFFCSGLSSRCYQNISNSFDLCEHSNTLLITSCHSRKYKNYQSNHV